MELFLSIIKIVAVVASGIFAVIKLIELCLTISYRKKHPYKLDSFTDEEIEWLADTYANSRGCERWENLPGGGSVRHIPTITDRTVASAIRGKRLSKEQLNSLQAFVGELTSDSKETQAYLNSLYKRLHSIYNGCAL